MEGQGGTTSSFHPLDTDHGELLLLVSAAEYRMARGAVSLIGTYDTAPLWLVVVYGTDLRPQAVAYGVVHQLRVAVSHNAAAVAPLRGVAAGDTDRPTQVVVVGDTDPRLLAVAFDTDHPRLEVAVYDAGRPWMDAQTGATSGGSFEELQHPRGQLA